MIRFVMHFYPPGMAMLAAGDHQPSSK